MPTAVEVDAEYVLDEYHSDDDSIISKVAKGDLSHLGLSSASANLLEKFASTLLMYVCRDLKLTISSD